MRAIICCSFFKLLERMKHKTILEIRLVYYLINCTYVTFSYEKFIFCFIFVNAASASAKVDTGNRFFDLKPTHSFLLANTIQP